MELGIPSDRLQDVSLLYGLAESTPDSGYGPMTDLKTRSTKMPPIWDISVIDALLDGVLRDLEHLRTYSVGNCTHQEQEALSSFEADTPILLSNHRIRGGNIVILDREQYEQMCKNLLSDRVCYETLDRDPTDIYQKELKSILKQAKSNRLIVPHTPQGGYVL